MRPPPSRSPVTGATSCSSTRPGFRATSAAATASPPERCACWSSSVSTPRRSTHGSPCPMSSCARRLATKWSSLPRGQGLYAAVARRVDLDSALIDVARSAGVKVLDGRAPVPRARNRPRSSSTLDGAGACKPATRSAPTACGRRCARRSTPPTPATWASGMPSAGTSPTSRPRRPAICSCGSSPTCSRLRVVVPAARRPRQRRIRHPARREGRPAQGHERRFGPTARPPAHPRRARDQRQPEAPHKAWPIPARIDDGAAHAGGRCSSATRRAATDPMTGEGIGQALLTGMLAGATVSVSCARRCRRVFAVA